jgi:hypothetical protein
MWEKIDMLSINFYRSKMMIFVQNNQRMTKCKGVYGAKVLGDFEQKGRFWSMKSNGGYV